MAAAAVAGLKPEQVQIHTTLLGGGFGRRANPASDFIVEAVAVAKALRAPVKVIWTREDDIRGGWYRPMWYDRMQAGFDASGNPIAWSRRKQTGASRFRPVVVEGSPRISRLTAMWRRWRKSLSTRRERCECIAWLLRLIADGSSTRTRSELRSKAGLYLA